MIQIRDARTILVPVGERYGTVAAAASEAFDIDFPAFPEGEAAVQFDGREYRRADDADIPALVGGGAADIGFAGLDSCIEAGADVTFRSFGEPFAFFDLRVPTSLANLAIDRLTARDEPLRVRTRYPRLLGSGALRKNLNLIAAEVTADLSIFADIVPAGDAVGDEKIESILRLREIRAAMVLPKAA